MSSPVFIQIFLLFAAFVTAVVSAWTKLTSKCEEKPEEQKKEKNIAIISLVIMAVVLSVQGYQSISAENENTILSKQVNETFSAVPEASGGVAIGEYVYLVSDERPKLFRAKYDADKQRYDAENVDTIDLHGELPGNDEKEKYILKKDDVNDLEGAAYRKRDGRSFIYLVTSHSDSSGEEEKINRQRFLEVELTGDEKKPVAVVRRWANLRKGLEKILFGAAPGQGIADPFTDFIELNAKKTALTKMQIEGLAIDEADNVYLGFRAPQKRGEASAVILRASLGEIFSSESGNPDKWKPRANTDAKASDAKFAAAESSEPKFETFFVNIGGDAGKDKRGVTDLVYYKNSLLILTNNIFKAEKSDVEIRQWSEIGTSGKTVSVSQPGFYKSPEKLVVKPEVLLLPDAEKLSGKLFLFLDAPTYGGGQRVYNRKDFTLKDK